MKNTTIDFNIMDDCLVDHDVYTVQVVKVEPAKMVEVKERDVREEQLQIVEI